MESPGLGRESGLWALAAKARVFWSWNRSEDWIFSVGDWRPTVAEVNPAINASLTNKVADELLAEKLGYAEHIRIWRSRANPAPATQPTR